MFKDVDEAFVNGLLMERTIAAPGIARNIIQPFTGKDYTQQMSEKDARKKEILNILNNPDLSEAVQKDLEKDKNK